MPWVAAASAAVGAYSAYRQAGEQALARLQILVDVKPREKSLDEIAREHRRKMEAEHAETMRGAKVGTWLLGALFVAVIYAAAQVAGFVP